MELWEGPYNNRPPRLDFSLLERCEGFLIVLRPTPSFFPCRSRPLLMMDSLSLKQAQESDR